MRPEVGQKLSLHSKKRSLSGEVIEATLLYNGDRMPYSKRDSNPVYKVTVRVPELNLTLTHQIEFTDRVEDNLIGSLEEAFSNDLAHSERH
jgi:hypothetical protein